MKKSINNLIEEIEVQIATAASNSLEKIRSIFAELKQDLIDRGIADPRPVAVIEYDDFLKGCRLAIVGNPLPDGSNTAVTTGYAHASNPCNNTPDHQAATAYHPPGAIDGSKIEFDAGLRIAQSKGVLPHEATNAAREGFASWVPPVAPPNALQQKALDEQKRDAVSSPQGSIDKAQYRAGVNAALDGKPLAEDATAEFTKGYKSVPGASFI